MGCSNIITLTNYENTRQKGFFCQNKGYKPIYIANSFVNDGICDCCDGSDEYNSGVNCQDTCKEKGKEELQSVKNEIQLHEEGAKQKLVMIEEAKRLRPSLQNDLDDARKKLEELKLKLVELEATEVKAKEISDLADEVHDDDSEDYIREDEEVDDEEKMLRRADPERISKRQEFEEKYGMSTQDAKDEYKAAKAEVKTCNKGIKDEEARVEQFEKLLNTDFGPEDEYLALRGQSFSTRAGGYNYELRVFESALQGSTSLGNWDGWKDKHSKMSYKGGKRCWGAGDREAEVTVICGTSNSIEQIDEPSTCSYTMILRTPAACSLEHARALRLSYELDDEVVLDVDATGNTKKSGWFY